MGAGCRVGSYHGAMALGHAGSRAMGLAHASVPFQKNLGGQVTRAAQVILQGDSSPPMPFSTLDGKRSLQLLQHHTQTPSCPTSWQGTHILNKGEEGGG